MMRVSKSRPLNIEDFYRRATRYYRDLLKKVDKCQSEFTRKLIESTKEGQKILDIGCGSGVIINHLSSIKKIKGIGIDIGGHGVELAEKYAKINRLHSKFMEASAYNLPFKDKSLDIVCSSEVLEHLENPQGAIDEMIRVVKPRGEIIISSPAWIMGRGRKVYWKLNLIMITLPWVIIANSISLLTKKNNQLLVRHVKPMLDLEKWEKEGVERLFDLDAVSMIAPASLVGYLNNFGSVEKYTTYIVLKSFTATMNNTFGRFFTAFFALIEDTPLVRHFGSSILLKFRRSHSV